MRTILLFALVIAPYFVFSQCGSNPSSGSFTTSSANQIINSYFPGNGNVAAGQVNVPIGSIDNRGSLTGLAAGDLVLIIQIQGASINSANDNTYGDGVTGDPGSGALTTNLDAGYYEFNTVNSATSTSVELRYTLANSYYTQSFSTSAPIRRFQVIRVPRLYDATIAAGHSLTAPAWNGSTGGVVVLDAVNTVNLVGSINVSARGFRGGGGKQFTGAGTNNTSSTTATTALQNTDFRFYSAATTAPNTTGGAKGEGIAGTPRYIFNPGSVVTVTGTEEGYVDGSMGRGAPGNAGGGSTDGIPVGNANNQYNTGGGGGSNAGAGGHGGSGWHGGSGNVNTYPFGGFGGAPFTARSLQRLIMGGGGGAGSANNSDATTEYQSSGGAGGGIIIVRAARYTGSGSLLANGGAAPGINGTPAANTDAAGGGGGGGTIVVVTRQAGATGLGTITASANGGAGGNMANYHDHGPGGGGGGGIIYSNGTLANAFVAGGANGVTHSTSTAGPLDNSYGAVPGGNGEVISIGFVPVLINTNNIASPCGTLPVTLVEFSGALHQSGVQLHCQVSDARNLERFEIEYSNDGVTYTRTGTVSYHAAMTDYQFLHQLVPSGVTYYRLKMIDTDGRYSYSNILTIRKRDVTGLRLYPNPADRSVSVEIHQPVAGSAVLSVVDITGKLISQKGIRLMQGQNVLVMETADLPSGSYMLLIEPAGGNRQSRHLQILR